MTIFRLDWGTNEVEQLHVQTDAHSPHPQLPDEAHLQIDIVIPGNLVPRLLYSEYFTLSQNFSLFHMIEMVLELPSLWESA